MKRFRACKSFRYRAGRKKIKKTVGVVLLENPRVPALLLCSRQMHLNGTSSAKRELPSLIPKKIHNNEFSSLYLGSIMIVWSRWKIILIVIFSRPHFRLMICQKTALKLHCIFGRVSEQLATRFIRPRVFFLVSAQTNQNIMPEVGYTLYFSMVCHKKCNPPFGRKKS